MNTFEEIIEIRTELSCIPPIEHERYAVANAKFHIKVLSAIILHIEGKCLLTEEQKFHIKDKFLQEIIVSANRELPKLYREF